jgi:hypothetical protein
MADYTRYAGQAISASLTLPRGRRPGAALLGKVLQVGRGRGPLPGGAVCGSGALLNAARRRLVQRPLLLQVCCNGLSIGP